MTPDPPETLAGLLLDLDDAKPFTRENCPPWYAPEVEERFAAAMEAFEKDPFAQLATWGRLRQLLAFLGVPLKESP